MWVIAAALFLSATASGATTFDCPKGTNCQEVGAVTSKSFQFLDELGPKQYQAITKLTVRNSSADKVPAKLKYLKNLQYFDISENSIKVDSIPSLPQLKILKLNQNNIKDIRLSLLPKNIEELHLSNNFLTHLPKDWSAIKSLKAINISKNLIDCSCKSNNIHIYQSLLKHNIKILAPVICHSPKHLAGKNLGFVANCTSEDEMINDQSLEGSGGGEDIFNDKNIITPILSEKNLFEENEIVDDKKDLPQEEAFVRVDEKNPVEDEGSGEFEGSGVFDVGNVLTCVVNCVSPEPIGSYDSVNDSAKAPEPTDQLRIIAEDIINPIIGVKTTRSTTKGPITEAVPSLPNGHETTEKSAQNKLNSGISNKGSLGTDSGLLNTQTEEVKKATAMNQNNYALYVVVICGLLLTVVILIYLIKKQKTKRLKTNRRAVATEYGEEMKTLQKPTLTSTNTKNGKPSIIPEHVSLINEQNGKAYYDPVLNSFKPLEHQEKNTIEFPKSIGSSSKYNEGAKEPVLREKFTSLLTPLTERVTIRASEIPNSVSKTPVLVHRQRNSEGKVINTVLA